MRNGGNASAAYVAAGYKDGPHVRKNAARLTTFDDVARRIDELRAEVTASLSEQTKLDIEKVVQRYTQAALADPRELMELQVRDEQ